MLLALIAADINNNSRLKNFKDKAVFSTIKKLCARAQKTN
jgi:hypothetical protein